MRRLVVRDSVLQPFEVKGRCPMVLEWLSVFDLTEKSLTSAWAPMFVYVIGAVMVLLAFEYVRREVWSKIFHQRSKRKV